MQGFEAAVVDCAGAGCVVGYSKNRGAFVALAHREMRLRWRCEDSGLEEAVAVPAVNVEVFADPTCAELDVRTGIGAGHSLDSAGIEVAQVEQLVGGSWTSQRRLQRHPRLVPHTLTKALALTSCPVGQENLPSKRTLFIPPLRSNICKGIFPDT